MAIALPQSVEGKTKRDGAAETRPMGDLNTTPLIDVMLCLLVMMILSIPTQTHSVKVDLPAGQTDTVIRRDHNDLSVTPEGIIMWNGVPTSFAQMQHNLTAIATMQPSPELRFRPDANARYVIVDSVLAAVKRSGAENLGFVDNERYHGVF